MQPLQETDFWNPTFFHHAYLELFTTASYETHFPEMFEDVDLHIRIYLWFTHTSAPPHFLLAFRAFLNKVFTEQWLGRGGPTVWPVRCPD
jgi:hypothetical protein